MVNVAVEKEDVVISISVTSDYLSLYQDDSTDSHGGDSETTAKERDALSICNQDSTSFSIDEPDVSWSILFEPVFTLIQGFANVTSIGVSDGLLDEANRNTTGSNVTNLVTNSSTKHDPIPKHTNASTSIGLYKNASSVQPNGRAQKFTSSPLLQRVSKEILMKSFSELIKGNSTFGNLGLQNEKSDINSSFRSSDTNEGHFTVINESAGDNSDIDCNDSDSDEESSYSDRTDDSYVSSDSSMQSFHGENYFNHSMESDDNLPQPVDIILKSILDCGQSVSVFFTDEEENGVMGSCNREKSDQFVVSENFNKISIIATSDVAAYSSVSDIISPSFDAKDKDSGPTDSNTTVVLDKKSSIETPFLPPATDKSNVDVISDDFSKLSVSVMMNSPFDANDMEKCTAVNFGPLSSNTHDMHTNSGTRVEGSISNENMFGFVVTRENYGNDLIMSPSRDQPSPILPNSAAKQSNLETVKVRGHLSSTMIAATQKQHCQIHPLQHLHSETQSFDEQNNQLRHGCSLLLSTDHSIGNSESTGTLSALDSKHAIRDELSKGTTTGCTSTSVKQYSRYKNLRKSQLAKKHQSSLHALEKKDFN